ncbi:ABC transporter substrate-binding protein [Allopusillimonas soli]|uniref:ABC transporter substrate-binding protein n=1 Tax=Allopusillimonas soli TaxID=659016 RepID=A0A853FCL2_9BURK|nr:ABC transporter substrate-binding protein [Allopusillimonas soli]NYT37488.1 ABC transporter substrate-binding protein [Allopusillimonas soli]TEA74871.1 ABC transporter substrate-binding protein [Allopusillimonas soli]
MAGLLLGAAAASSYAQTLRIGLQDDPDTLDPARARTYVSRIVFTSLCNKLVDIDAKLKFVPQLATSWSWSDDAKTLTMKLRDDVVFHDGSKFDAAAAKANLDRAMTLKSSQRKSELASVESVDAPDPATLVIHVKQPDATLLAQLSDRAGMMLSPKTFAGEDSESSIGRHPVCSGPYKFVKRIQNDRIELEKFDKYYDAKDFHFDKLVFLYIPDTTVRLQNLRSGGIDILERLNPTDVKQVKADDGLILMPVTGLGYRQFTFNVNNGPKAKTNPFANKLVRQAFQLTIDRAAIDQVIGGGLFTAAQQPFPEASPYFSDKFPVVKPDIAKAKALLKQAGMSTVQAELVFANNTVESSTAQMVQAMASQAGFQLSLRPMEYAAMLADDAKGNFQIDMRGWSGRVDPDGNIFNFVTCKGALNDSRYCNEEVDKLLKQARTVPDETKRKAIYEQALTILQDDLPRMFTYYQPWLFATTKQVHGLTPYPDGMIRLKGVTLSK